MLTLSPYSFAARDVRLSRLPGWESNSWGYHGDDGYSFAAEKSGTPFGPTFGSELLLSSPLARTYIIQRGTSLAAVSILPRTRHFLQRMGL